MDTGQSSVDTNQAILTPNISANFLIRVISLEGNVVDISVEPDYTIERIKMIALESFYDGNTQIVPSQFKLIHSSKVKQLDNDCTVNEEEIGEYDELILVEGRPSPTSEKLSEEDLKGPSLSVILKTTSEPRTIKNPKRSISTDKSPEKVERELRKIMISLVEASARIMMYNPEAEELCNVLNERLKSYKIDPKSIEILKNTDYSHKKILMALELKKSDVKKASEWLLKHKDYSDDEEIEDDLDSLFADDDLDEFGPSTSVNRSLKKERNLVGIVELLLKIFRRHNRMNFMPDMKLIQEFQSNGFETKKIIKALRITGNDKEYAHMWLLGDRRPSLQDLNKGFHTDSPIYIAIMNNPHIQLALTNPRILLVFLSILEYPNSMAMWNADSEVFSVIAQISRIYLLEKDTTQLNQFAAN